MNYAKIVGWIVFLTGLILISWTLFSSYNIFTGKSAVPVIFEMPKATAAPKSGEVDLQAQLQNMIGEQLKGLLPTDSISKILNLTVYSILIFILIFGGTQISSLGIKLMKN